MAVLLLINIQALYPSPLAMMKTIIKSMKIRQKTMTVCMISYIDFRPLYHGHQTRLAMWVSLGKNCFSWPDAFIFTARCYACHAVVKVRFEGRRNPSWVEPFEAQNEAWEVIFKLQLDGSGKWAWPLPRFF